MGTGATEPAEPAEGRRPRPAKAAFAAPPEREERRTPQPRAGDASNRAGKVPPPMLFQAPPEEPVDTVRPRTGATTGAAESGENARAGAADKDAGGGERRSGPPADAPPTDATPAKAPRPRKTAAPAPADATSPAKKANPKKAAAAKRTPAARTPDQPADAVKDPAPAETKIPTGRKAVVAPAPPTETTPAKAIKKAAPKKAAAKKSTARTPASDVTAAPTPDPGLTEEPVTVNNEAAPTAQRTQPAAEAPAPEPAANDDLAPIHGGGLADAAPTKPGAGSLWRVPETAAAAAVKRFTPQADAWAQEIRSTYPTATNDGLARLAQQRFIRKTTAAGAAASLANGWSSAADLVATSWVNAELIAHIAAAYGKQATAADLLVLTGVHQDHESAQAAIDGTPGHSASRAPITAAGKTATWAALKILGRWWPGLAAAGGAATATLNTERVAARAIQRFRAS
jgi:hypothetical protein